MRKALEQAMDELKRKRFAFDEAPPRMICPRCGFNLRSATPERMTRPHSQPAESQKANFQRMKTWAGNLSMRGSADAFNRREIYLDIVGFQPHEVDQYNRHCQLQRFEPLVSPKGPDTPMMRFGDMTPQSGRMDMTPKGASAMSMDLQEPELAVIVPPTPTEPSAPPVMQRRLSARDAKLVEGGKRLCKSSLTASAPSEPFTAIISGSKEGGANEQMDKRMGLAQETFSQAVQNVVSGKIFDES
eukprot:g3810.t1